MTGLWEDLIGKSVKVVFIDNAKDNREKVYRGKLIGVDSNFLKLEMSATDQFKGSKPRKSMIPLNVVRKVNEIVPGKEDEE